MFWATSRLVHSTTVNMSDAKAFATIGIYAVLGVMSHLLRLVLRSGPFYTVQLPPTVPPTHIHYKGGVGSRLFLLAEQVVELGLLATFPPKTPFLDLVIVSPFPTSRDLLIQVCILLLAEECVRIWAYKIVASLMSKQDDDHEGDTASVLAAECLIPKAIPPFSMVMLGVPRATGVRQRVIHLAVLVCWTAPRQFHVFERGLDPRIYASRTTDLLGLLDLRTVRV
ncbi:MAG: hypothetical protein LQ348_004766 [Seirophora lacunosa]|nr:MAG: hypothetical protein LQ348_004766 [Seirophora lacunosa]